MGNTIEKKKVKNGKYEYFVADNDGKLIKSLKGYFNGKLIAETYIISEDNQGNTLKEIYNRYYEFEYNIITDEKEVQQQGYLDTGLDYPQYSEWSVTLGGDRIILKSILDDNGDEILNMITSVDEYIPEVEAFIVTLPHKLIGTFDSCWFEDDWNSAEGKDSILRCVVNINGDFIVKPVRHKDIIYLPTHKLFSVGNSYLYNENGEKESFNILNKPKSLSQIINQEADKNKKSNNRIYDLKTNKVGFMLNGTPVINTEYDDLVPTVCGNYFKVWESVFKVLKDGKYGFIKIVTPSYLVIVPLKYDVVLELQKEGYLCKITTENKTDVLLGFSDNGEYLLETVDSLDETKVLETINDRYKHIQGFGPISLAI